MSETQKVDDAVASNASTVQVDPNTTVIPADGPPADTPPLTAPIIDTNEATHADAQKAPAPQPGQPLSVVADPNALPPDERDRLVAEAGRPNDGIPPTTTPQVVRHTAAGEIHPSLVGGTVPTEIHRADDPTLAPLRAARAPTVARRDVLSPEGIGAVVLAQTGGDTNNRQPGDDAYLGDPNAPVNPNVVNAPGVFTPGATPPGGGVAPAYTPAVPAPTEPPPAFTPEELQVAQDKDTIEFVNGKRVRNVVTPNDARAASAARDKLRGATVAGAIDGIKQGVKQFLSGTSRNAREAQAQIDAFVGTIAPDVEAQIAPALAGDVKAQLNLGFLFDSTVAETGRLADDLMFQEKQALAAMVVGVVQGIATLAKGLVAPALMAAVA